jgi:hypothetical protein
MDYSFALTSNRTEAMALKFMNMLSGRTRTVVRAAITGSSMYAPPGSFAVCSPIRGEPLT